MHRLNLKHCATELKIFMTNELFIGLSKLFRQFANKKQV